MSIPASFVLWLTGLSAAGKSSIGREIYRQLKLQHPECVLLDGDEFRAILGNQLGHNLNDRIENAYRIARMCQFLAAQQLKVICCTMSLYPEIWSWNRANISNYFEVYLRVNKETVSARDPRGLYAAAKAGTTSNVVGVDLAFNEPQSPDLIIDNDVSGHDQITLRANEIIKFLERA